MFERISLFRYLVCLCVFWAMLTGQAAAESGQSIEDQLKQLKTLYDSGLITEDIYKQRMNQVLDSMQAPKAPAPAAPAAAPIQAKPAPPAQPQPAEPEKPAVKAPAKPEAAPQAAAQPQAPQEVKAPPALPPINWGPLDGLFEISNIRQTTIRKNDLLGRTTVEDVIQFEVRATQAFDSSLSIFSAQYLDDEGIETSMDMPINLNPRNGMLQWRRGARGNGTIPLIGIDLTAVKEIRIKSMF